MVPIVCSVYDLDSSSLDCDPARHRAPRFRGAQFVSRWHCDSGQNAPIGRGGGDGGAGLTAVGHGGATTTPTFVSHVSYTSTQQLQL